MQKELNQGQWAKLHQLQNGLVEKMVMLVSEEVAKIQKKRKISAFTLDEEEEDILCQLEEQVSKIVVGMEKLVEDFRKKSSDISKEEPGG